MAASLASAQQVNPPLPPAGETVQTPATEEVAPADGDPRAEGPPPPEEQPSHPPSFPKMLLLDTGCVLAAPFHWERREWLLFAASTAGMAVLSLADESLSDAAREHGTTLGFVGDATAAMGDARSLVLLGGFYLVGAIGGDSKAKNVFFDGLSASLIASGIITPALQSVIGRERPTAEQGAYSFHPFEGRSFPSGHTTQAFTVASVIATSYDQVWVKATAYGVAALAGYARVRQGKHFPTDIVGGALIGTLVGRSVVRFNSRLRSGEKEPESTGARLTILPVLGGGTYGVSASLDF